MQLVAYGAQDVFLTGTPEITFWKVSYRRHTNFAMESIEQTFSGQADFGRRVTCTVSRNGDLAYRTYLQVVLPEINQNMVPLASQAGGATRGVYARWLDYIGEQLISQVEVEIGGQRIDRQYGDWMHIWNQMTMSAAQQRGYWKMIGHTTALTYITDPTFAGITGPCASSSGPAQVCAPRNALPETTLYIPLLFWFCKNPGLALPLIALQYHEVKFNIDFRPIGECLWAVSNLDANAGNTSVSVTQAYQQSLVAASLYIDYVFLDTDERRKMAQNPHEYLIEQLQFTGDESVGSSSNKIKLNFNHPCKELVWVVQPDANVDYCSSLLAGTTLFRTLGAQPFNYTDAIDALPNAIHAFGGPAETQGANAFINPAGLFQMAGATDGAGAIFGTALSIPAATVAGSSITLASTATAPAVGTVLALNNGGSTFAGYVTVTASAAGTATTGPTLTISPALTTGLNANSTATPLSGPPGGLNVNQSWGNGTYGAFDPVTFSTQNNQTTQSAATTASGSFVSDAGTFVLAETALDMHCWGQNPVVTAKLQLNGQDRFSEREGSYFDVVQPFQHHTRAPDTGINVYSFALRPEEHQPSGSCNFSRIDNATLQLVLSAPTVSGTSTAKVRVYAVNYNVLRVMSGMAGQAYSN